MHIKASTFSLWTATFLSLGLTGCIGGPADRISSSRANVPTPTTFGEPVAPAMTATPEGYKQYLAQRIAAVNSTKVYIGRPQALLRAVIVLKIYVDADGQLLRTEIMRSNKDRVAEAVALSSVKNASPFPKPDKQLLRKGEVEVSESWLFNTDGRFQLRTLAEAQMNE
ncbi:energy transducer TonB family protein [Glaciimonas immobilis]|uniref:Protein TonB n=1 Tax=Glaciimonas immobilis TaxID=728004 RepID=A0A840RRZ1_9BURK|nr:TonB family protein [Glaciimonas immobilis]KAF3996907.1 TonB family protein [Glaciimonas immobilis]MBB5199726.1 protein TonB [Glaciimonas immobilis]